MAIVAKRQKPGRRQPSATRLRRVFFGLSFLILALIAIGALTYRGPRSALIPTANETPAEMAALAEALEVYRLRFGEYPPAAETDETMLRRHLQHRFPNLAEDEILPLRMDAAEALVFWLGGFSTSSTYPISGAGGPLNMDAPRNAGIYAFDPQRLVLTSNGKQMYIPPGLARTEPYLYFRDIPGQQPAYPFPPIAARMEPYRNAAGDIVHGDAYQLLCAGEDDQWGELPAPPFPAGPFDGGHADNLTNFRKGTLGQVNGAKP